LDALPECIDFLFRLSFSALFFSTAFFKLSFLPFAFFSLQERGGRALDTRVSFILFMRDAYDERLHRGSFFHFSLFLFFYIFLFSFNIIVLDIPRDKKIKINKIRVKHFELLQTFQD